MHQEAKNRSHLPRLARLAAVFLAALGLSCRQADPSFEFVDSRGDVFRVTPVALETSQYIGEVRDGSFDGLGFLSAPGDYFYLGRFHNGVMHGRGMLIVEDCVTYAGHFRDNKANGLGIAWYKGGRIYMGELKDGLRDGLGKMIFPDGDVEDGLWENDQFVKPRSTAVKTSYSVNTAAVRR